MDNKTTFASLGKVEAIRQLFENTPYKAFEEPCFFEAGAKAAVTTASKCFLEGIDFDLVYFPLKHLGYKCVIAATAELYAVMSHPRTLSVCLGISAKLDYDSISELWKGIVSAASEHGYKQVSLDLQPSRNGLCISVSATGECYHLTCARRSKAKSKDLVCVTGSLGAAYMGLQLLEKEKIRFNAGSVKAESLEQNKMLVAAYLQPELSSGIVTQLEEAELYPSYGYVVSKGLADAMLRLSRDSGLGVKVYADKIPFEGNTFSVGKELNADPVSAAMNGGDDYRILFTVPILKLDLLRHDFQTFDIIGFLAQPEVGQVLVTPDGVEFPVKAQGYLTSAL